MGTNIKSVQAYLIGLSLPLASEESFLKNKLDRETYTSCENFQKCSKSVTIFSSNLKCIFGLENVEILFSLFLKKLQIIEFPFKKTSILNQLEFLSRKLEPKYEASAASSSTSFQNSNGDQHQIHSSSFKQVISSLSFRKKLIIQL